jgi:hypothetical protein
MRNESTTQRLHRKVVQLESELASVRNQLIAVDRQAPTPTTSPSPLSSLPSPSSSSSCVLCTVSYSGHFRVLLQFYLSYAANIIDPGACKLLVLVSTPSEVNSLTKVLQSEEHASQLSSVLAQLTIVDFPAALARLSPGVKTQLPHAKNRGEWGRLYVCAKKAYAARYAHEVLDAGHAIVTDSEAYVWKPLSIGSLFREIAARPAVWYSDAPAHTRDKHAHQALAPVDTNWCSLHVFSDARGTSRQQMQRRVPSRTAGFFEYMLFSYPRTLFRQYWASVETVWRKPLFDALIDAHVAEPRCVGIGFWLEVSWHLFLFEREREHYAFRNVTAAIERSFGAPFALRSGYVNARLELLWRALTNSTYRGFADFYERQRLPFFRYEYRQRGACLPLRLVAQLEPPVASFQANSAVPNWVFTTCGEELRLLRQWDHLREDGSSPGGARALPWVKHNTVTR